MALVHVGPWMPSLLEDWCHVCKLWHGDMWRHMNIALSRQCKADGVPDRSASVWLGLVSLPYPL